MKMNGARVLVECLIEQGVDTIFGYPGGTVLNIYDALYDTEEITHIITAHEQGATHAADGYARSTGKVGVVLATSGPGATNTVTGIATAYRDSIPMVVITGQVARHLIGKDSFQEIDITDITKSITKQNYMVMDPSKLPDIVREAFFTATTGRPGPVLIDIPKDIQQAEIEFIKDTGKPHDKDNTPIENNLQGLEAAVKLINEAMRPVIFSGGGIISSNASKELIEFAEKINAPVSTSLMGIGGFPGSHKLNMGMLGMHGSFSSNFAFSKADLVIALGSRFNDRVTCRTDNFAKDASILHIDIDPSEFGKNVEHDLSLCGNLKSILTYLTEKINSKEFSLWNENVIEWKSKFDNENPHVGDLSPKYLLTKLSELTNDNSIVCTEVGQNQMWTAKYYQFNKPRTFISSGGHGTMGFGLGAAIGCAIGKPDKRIINVAGDGSFKMNLQELSTISKYSLPIVQIVLNNSTLGMVRQWQKLFYNNRLSQTTLTPDVNFIKLAHAFGIKAYKITKDDEVEAVLSEAFALNEPVLIECVIDSDNMVTPMVPLGESIDNCLNNFENLVK